LAGYPGQSPWLVLVFILLTVDSGMPSAQTARGWIPASTLTASNAGEDDHLGAGNALTGVALALSRDGRMLAVAAPHEDSDARGVNGNQRNDSAFDSGAVYVFTQSGSSWVQQAYLKASNAASGDQFGFAVALSGDGNTLAVAANFEDSGATGIGGNQNDESASGAGAVYVFVRNGAAWSQQAYIKTSNAAEGDRFGYSLALSDDGNTLAVGAIGEDSVSTGTGGNEADNSAEQAGATYVFVRGGAAWSQQAYLKASNTQAGDMFGFCVALSGDGNTLGVCAYDEDSSAEGIDGDQADNRSNGSGAAYVLVRSGTVWRQQAYVKASNTTLQGAFGAAIAISGDGNTLAICAVDEDGLNPGVGAVQWQADRKAAERTRVAEDSAGAVYIYGRSGTTWSFQTYVKSSNIRANDYFGNRLALNRDGTILAAGAPQQPGGGSGVNPVSKDASAPESGAVYVFARGAGGWRQEAYVKAPDAAEYDQFGSAVAVSGDSRVLAAAAMAADGRDNAVRDAGAVYVFTRSEGR
jgi:hypothetical protein